MSPQCCQCTEDEVLAYVSGELVGDEELAVAVHLGECEDCCDQAADFRALDIALPACCQDEAIRWHRFETPFGTMYLARSHDGLVRLSWRQDSDEGFLDHVAKMLPDRPIVHDAEALSEAETELREYFAGERSEFDLPVDLSCMTEFQRAVLEETRAIGFGRVVPYSELARRLGKPKAARAVGNALGSNPLAIVVPCHRVVRNDGSLGGYTGGLRYKRHLLTIEGRTDLAAAS
jgi:methylated-DNA-[protein]-cysteine S-methyltransferase